MIMKKILAFLACALVIVQPLLAKTYKHEIQLQLADDSGAPIPNTQFWVKLDVVIKGDQITVNFPNISFQVSGQCDPSDPECTPPSPGYIVTAAGFLPPEWRPNSLIPVTVLASAGDGLAGFNPTSFSVPPPPPPPGFIVLITNAGEVIIQQAASPGFSNVISIGAHTVLPCSLTYIRSTSEEICFNFPISHGEIDVTQFPGDSFYLLAGGSIRDSHINDAFDDTFAWAWTDNHNINYANGTLNLFVAIGKIDSEGQLKVGKPVQLTNLPPYTIAWDTSIAINRLDKNNIVVSYGLIPCTAAGVPIHPWLNCRAVSFDGGKTWGGVFDGTNTLPYNGPISYQTPPLGFGDYPGVKADQYGNFWIGSTDFNNADQPYLLISSNQGVDWNLAYTLPPATLYDYPHLVFGNNGLGQYGIWYYTDSYDPMDNLLPSLTFIPITGLGTYGTGSTTFLPTLANAIAEPTIAASNDGRFWGIGGINETSFTYNYPLVTLFKSPGALNENYAGPWLTGSFNGLAELVNSSFAPTVFQFDSAPYTIILPFTVQGLIYDNKRQALYGLFTPSIPSLSQNMQLYFAISRNNGQTWSEPYKVSTTAFANRGFSSMALDPKSGNIYLGWYDGRNDPKLKKLKYFGGVIPSKMLDKLVKKSQVSNPIYSIPNQGTSTPP